MIISISEERGLLMVLLLCHICTYLRRCFSFWIIQSLAQSDWRTVSKIRYKHEKNKNYLMLQFQLYCFTYLSGGALISVSTIRWSVWNSNLKRNLECSSRMQMKPKDPQLNVFKWEWIQKSAPSFGIIWKALLLNYLYNLNVTVLKCPALHMWAQYR